MSLSSVVSMDRALGVRLNTLVFWVSVVGIVGVVGSLAFSGWQTRELVRQTKIQNKIADVAAEREPIAVLQAILIRLAEAPELRKFFYDGVPCPTSEPERSRVLIIAEMLADAIYGGLHASVLFSDTNAQQARRNYSTSMLVTCPTLYDLLVQHHDWWPPDYQKVIDAASRTRQDRSATNAA